MSLEGNSNNNLRKCIQLKSGEGVLTPSLRTPVYGMFSPEHWEAHRNFLSCPILHVRGKATVETSRIRPQYQCILEGYYRPGSGAPHVITLLVEVLLECSLSNPFCQWFLTELVKIEALLSGNAATQPMYFS